MSASELQVAYQPDDDGTGKIVATVKSGEFSARGAAWVNPIDVKQTFVAALRSFPLTATTPALIEGGFWSKEKPGSLEQCHLRIVVRPYDVRGTLLVHVDLSSEVWTTPDADLQNLATIRFTTEYVAVDRFAQEFEAVLDGERDVAVLTGISS
ncbi:hypothetical protein [Bradyrhizobium sp. 170]|uniref:hypothetical protein n=1 Tax=Bradyrhizobium sp. 170 TaxID=2782641 RepID=UPI001FFED4B9|nr:hypothetical protein [Bradyrhizobium sp. 170]UPK01573.1 hypothetical protein IVB05_28420 [Bradyrhizobium sp. 170]